MIDLLDQDRGTHEARLPHNSAIRRPVIGLLWGDFPWEASPHKVGKLLSTGVVARNVTRALAASGTVVPFVAPADPAAHPAVLRAFLQQIDVLWADAYPGSAAALEVRQHEGLSCRAIVYAGGTLPKGVEALLFPWQRLLRPGDGLLCTCQADLAIWRRLVRWSALREWMVPLAVDETVFHPRDVDQRLATRRAHGLPPAAPLLLYVGRLNIQKNLHILLRLLAAVRRDVPEVHLCLVGEEDDIVLGEFGVRNTNYVQWLRGLAVDLDVADAVTILAPLFGEDLAGLYAASDVCVNTGFYHRENFGLAQAEAQACGVPVVCSAWGGFKDVVRPGETGYLIDAVLTKHGVRVDWATGAAHVVALLRDPALRARMAAQAASWAHEQFSIAALAGRLATVVAEVTAPIPDTAIATPAYEPSAFARRYEAHKRACGWYATAEERQRTWDPPMFQGRDYALYETLLGPYATRLATDVPHSAIHLTWVPYYPSGVALDPLRRVAEDHDPVWPHRRFLDPVEWEILRRVDGVATVGHVIDGVTVAGVAVDPPVCSMALWRLAIEGFVLFQAGIEH